MLFEIQQGEIQPELENWLYFTQAKAQGFQFLLKDDGDAEILSPDGEIYTVDGFKCRCTNHVYRTYCLHELWVRQCRPCEQCGCIMELGEFTTCFGQTMQYFQCSSCGNARDLDLVKEERRIGLKDCRLSSNGRCKQAIAWLKVKGSDWYVWQLVYQSPELIGTMVIALSDVGEDMLADKIIQEAGYKAA